MFVMERQTESNRQSRIEEEAKHEFNQSDSEDFIAVNIYEGNQSKVTHKKKEVRFFIDEEQS